LGYLEVNFNQHGDLLKPVNGAGVRFAQPYVLDSTIEENQQVLKAMEPFMEQLKKYKKVIGSSEVFLQGNRAEESLLGDFATDAFRHDYYSIWFT
jgi:hypothetical protein